MAPSMENLRAIYTLLYDNRGDMSTPEIAEETGLDLPTVESGLEILLGNNLMAVNTGCNTHFSAKE